ncbi:hypothetical protein [Polystyrenella longa]|uniref:hypothetical protein n=1 Tax=Polystyrenella longa TaxID=2528007 RepID=UPI0018D22C1C|nr:hypothetical protein [Polystyrenella longa]
MMTTVERPAIEKKLNELNVQLAPEISYRLETLFPKYKGRYAAGTIRNRVKLLHRLDSLLPEILLDGEVVQFLCKGKMTSSRNTYLVRMFCDDNMRLHVVLVLTNLRLLCIETNRQGAPNRTCWSVYYNQIDKVETGITDEVVLLLKDGLRVSYYEFSQNENLMLKQVTREMGATFAARGFNPPSMQSRQQLCGKCFHSVLEGDYECPNCRTLFWTPLEIATRSFLFPPWGTFLLGHYGVAMWEAVLFFAILFFDFNSIRQGNFSNALLLLILGNILAAFFTSRITSKGLYLKDAVN